MDRDEDSPTPADDHEATLGSTAHSGSRWEPRDGDDELREPPATVGADTSEDPAPVADSTSPVRPRRRAGRVAAGIGAAVLLAGAGFGAGFAVGDSGPDGGPDGGPGLSHHHGDRADQQGRTGQAPTGQAPTGQNTSGSASPILGGLFT